MRSVDEWVAKHDDQAIPPRVRLRVFEKFGGICQISGRKIMAGEAWDLDHVKALWRGGEHREANLQPVLKQPHREKSAEEQSIQAKCDRIRKKHLGLWPSSKAKIKSRGFANSRDA
ncbi:HNH endonuclease signature motif containing protein [Ensifer sp. SL37]|nr:HNH endonuclease signature motif containing protein [Ensifer sp. SL37]MCY1741199.1 HNH endonuclease signature motif containing protein [Ensifer sp. SL37]